MSTTITSSNDVNRNRVPQSTLSLAAGEQVTLTLSDAGTDQQGATWYVLPLLNENVIGITFRIRNTATSGFEFIVSPQKENKLVGSVQNAASIVTAANNGEGAFGQFAGLYVYQVSPNMKYGDWIEVTAISATEWAICGNVGNWEIIQS